MGETISSVTTAKNLGVVFDQNLSFSTHTDQVVRRCTGLLCCLSHGKHYLPETVFATIVQGLVLSIVRYCIVVYGASNITQMTRIQKLINFAARVISGRRKYDHIRDVLDTMGWLDATDLYLYHGLTLLKRILACGEPEPIASALITRRAVHQRATRNAESLSVPQIRSEFGRHRFMYSIVSAFNLLPSDLRNLPPARFKKELKQYLTDRRRRPP